MKKSFALLAAFALLFVACKTFSNRGEVVAPMIGGANQYALGVEKVSLTDSSTVVDFVVHFEPGMWVRMAPSSAIIADGTAYEAVAFDGIEPDEQVTMPDSGVIRFAVTFPAIPADVSSFDFSEQADGGWQIWDIDLTGNKDHNYNRAQVPADVIEADRRAEIPAPVIAAGDSATVNIHLLGYRPEMGNKLFWVINTPSGQYGSDSPLDVDAQGNATARLDLTVPSEFIIIGLDHDGSVRISGVCMLSPGETADLYADTHLSGIRNMNVASGDSPYSYPEDFTASYYKGRYPGYKQLVTYGLNIYSGSFGDYHMNGDQYTDYLLSEYARSKAKIDSASTTDSQRDFRTAMLNVDLIQAASDAFGTLARNYYSTKGGYGSGIPLDSIPVRLSADNVKAIAALIDFSDPNLMLSSSVGRATANTQLWQDAGVDPGVLESVRLYNVAHKAAEGGKLDSVAVSQLRERSEPLAAAAESYFRASKARLDALDMAMITPTPAVAPEKIFDAIVAPHKGKVVMVDLWNTWCGPCRASIAANEPEKDGDLSSDDIVWIYIADESSPLTTYLDMIKNIRGIHYRLTDEQIDVIRNHFEVDGLPYYIFVDRKGNAAGRPDFRDHSLYKKTILDQLK